MIGKLTGTIDVIYDDYIILDVAGVGYRIFCSNKSLSSLEAKSKYSFFIETYIREDIIRLYGFKTKLEQDWFVILQSIPGVGAKVSLAILGVFDPNELVKIILDNNVSFLCRVNGIGKKVAERIINELKHKKFSGISNNIGQPMVNNNIMEAISALENLGYNKTNAQEAVTRAQEKIGKNVETTELIKLSLKEITIKG
ncbi:Holliday junction branch migration protein RuvA [Bartonella sp. DGB1]|uniref:Holliday junction branch migration protein RuvA n=1 Tax=Bartonella sp. DGB1 TaxID=3239807 RepID=UPI003525BD4C